jgi:hypothetical protein
MLSLITSELAKAVVSCSTSAQALVSTTENSVKAMLITEVAHSKEEVEDHARVTSDLMDANTTCLMSMMIVKTH